LKLQIHVADIAAASLIVAGTHGRRGFDHWLIGSVSERLLRRVSIPILTVGHVEKTARLPNVKRILIGVDFSAGTTETVSWGFWIAQRFQTRVTLVHVYDFVTGDIPDHYKQSLLDGIRLEREKLIPRGANAGNAQHAWILECHSSSFSSKPNTKRGA
jgi:nucleotide-binding universal stress UspA family protein